MNNDALDAHFAANLSIEEADRWRTAIDLVTDLRVYRFEALERCPDFNRTTRASVRVRWTATGGADGLSLSSPKIVTATSSVWERCALEILEGGVHVAAEELGGELPAMSLNMVVVVPVVVGAEVRTKIRHVEELIASNLRAGLPPLKEHLESPSASPTDARSPPPGLAGPGLGAPGLGAPGLGAPGLGSSHP